MVGYGGVFSVYNYYGGVFMFNLIENIHEGSVLEINKKKYRALAKVKYVTESETTNWYVKIKLESHHVLVIAPFDNYMYFGSVGEPYPCGLPAPDSIVYCGKIYTKDAEDYQIVKDFVFGDFLSMEGEVQYADFSCGDSLISLGVILRTQKRADVYAKVIDLSDVIIV